MEQHPRNNELARDLRDQASEHGLRFEVYLPGGLAEWVLDAVGKGAFRSPAHAVFSVVGEARDLEPHTDLRMEVLRRTIERAKAEPGQAYSMDEIFFEMEQIIGGSHDPAVWPSDVPEFLDQSCGPKI